MLHKFRKRSGKPMIFMGKCLVLELKDKINRRYPPAIIAAVSAYVIFFGICRNHIRAENFMDAVSSVLRTSIVCFVAVAFLALDIFYDLRKNALRDMVCTKKHGMRRIVTVKFITVLIPLVIFYVEMLFVCFVPVWRGIPVSDYIRENVAASLFLNYVLFPLAAIGMGALLGIMLHRWQGYLALLCLLLVELGVFAQFSASLFGVYDGKINLDSISRLLTLKQPNMIWTVDALYLIPTESYRYFLYAGWILLFAALFLFYVEKKKREGSWAALAYWRYVSFVLHRYLRREAFRILTIIRIT